MVYRLGGRRSGCSGVATVIAVLDYGIGNLRSAQKALQHVGADAVLASSPTEARGASGFVLPGVGAFGRSVDALRASGLADVAVEAIEKGAPFLGICVGLQMLYESSEEDADAEGLGVIGGRVVRLAEGVKVPQMQWNLIESTGGCSEMMSGLKAPEWVYFVHSYAPEPTGEVVGTCAYGGPVTAAIERGNLWGTQFHPEKSGAAGLRLMEAFVRLCADTARG